MKQLSNRLGFVRFDSIVGALPILDSWGGGGLLLPSAPPWLRLWPQKLNSIHSLALDVKCQKIFVQFYFTSCANFASKFTRMCLMVGGLRLEPLENLTLVQKSHNWNNGKDKGKDMEERKRLAEEERKVVRR